MKISRTTYGEVFGIPMIEHLTITRGEDKNMTNKFEISTFDGESICFEFNSIIVCNRNIKEQILNGYVEIEAPKPFIIMTNDKFTDEEVEILEDASIADCLRLYKHQPAFGGILV